MNTEVLPIALAGAHLEKNFLEAPSLDERQRRGSQLLAWYIFTDLDRAETFLQDLDKSITLSPVLRLRFAGLIANQRGAWYEAAEALTQAEDLARQANDKALLYDILLYQAAVCMNKREWRQAEEFLDQSARLLRTPSGSQRFHLAIRQGYLQLYRDQWTAALAAFMQAERLMATLPSPRDWDDLDRIVLLYSGMGEVYMASGERELARLAFRKASHLCDHYGLHTRRAWLHLCTGNASMALERWEEAAQCFRDAMLPHDVADSSIQASAEANLAFTLIQKNQFETAAAHLLRAEKYYLQPPADKKNLATISMWHARIAMHHGSRKDVMQHFIKASEYAREIQDNRLLARVCREIAVYFAGQQDHKNAYDYLLLYDELAEKARVEEQQQRLLELQVQYETEQVEREADQLRAQALDLRLQVMRAQMNPHFLFNALNGIQNFIHEADSDKASRYLAKFAGLVRQALNMSNAELITLEEEVAFMRDYLFINQKLRFDGRLEFSLTVDDDIEEDRVMIPPMMIQPFVENAIEHGFIKRAKGRIDISLDLESEDVLRCTILDNGIGRIAAVALRKADPLRQEHQSLGMAITAERIELLNRSGFEGHHMVVTDLHDDVGSPIGTKVELWFPARRKGAR
jgi:two-component system LytT family sensor kinase